MSNNGDSAAVGQTGRQTACILCSLNCGIEVDVEDGAALEDPWR